MIIDIQLVHSSMQRIENNIVMSVQYKPAYIPVRNDLSPFVITESNIACLLLSTACEDWYGDIYSGGGTLYYRFTDDINIIYDIYNKKYYYDRLLLNSHVDERRTQLFASIYKYLRKYVCLNAL